MQAFAILLDRLSFTYSNNAKLELLKQFFAQTPDPDRGYAIAAISGSLEFPSFKRTIIKELLHEQIDPYLFSLSYDYVGDMSETVSLLWKNPLPPQISNLPSLTEIIHKLKTLSKTEIKNYLKNLLDQSNTIERWALLKLSTHSLRIGVSARFIKQALAQYGAKDIQEIEHIWHGLVPPYSELFNWLENKAVKPDIKDNLFFHPVMLAQPLDDAELEKINPEYFVIERKIDGIRIQFIQTSKGKTLFSRSGEDISAAFPDILDTDLASFVVLDGELVIKQDETIGSFNALQQRLNRKKPSKKLMQDSPAHIILYDILILDNHDLRALSFSERRQILETWFETHKNPLFSLSEILSFKSHTELITLKETILASKDVAVEGLMLKRKLSTYVAGRPSGQWYKWKRDPYLVDAVLMYAQRGHGKRSSFYSDYTFGLWENDGLLPIGKAYFGFTDEELKLLDKWIRNHTTHKFGPVREVKKELVLEIAFDAVNVSSRHKSGFALRFPRINRIRWDKPAAEADQLENLKKFL